MGGVGLLAYPYAFSQTGLLGGTFLMMIVMIFAVGGNFAIVYACEHIAPGVYSYQVKIILKYSCDFS